MRVPMTEYLLIDLDTERWVCRVCERDNCPQRAFPALGRALDLDEHRSTVTPYVVKRTN